MPSACVTVPKIRYAQHSAEGNETPWANSLDRVQVEAGHWWCANYALKLTEVGCKVAAASFQLVHCSPLFTAHRWVNWHMADKTDVTWPVYLRADQNRTLCLMIIGEFCQHSIAQAMSGLYNEKSKSLQNLSKHIDDISMLQLVQCFIPGLPARLPIISWWFKGGLCMTHRCRSKQLSVKNDMFLIVPSLGSFVGQGPLYQCGATEGIQAESAPKQVSGCDETLEYGFKVQNVSWRTCCLAPTLNLCKKQKRTGFMWEM